MNSRQLSRTVSPELLVLANRPLSSLLRTTWNWWPECTPPMMKESFNIGLQPRVLRMLPEPTTGTARDELVEVEDAVEVIELIGLFIGLSGPGLIASIGPVAAIIGLHAPGAGAPAAIAWRLFMMSSIICWLSASCTPPAEDRPKFMTNSSSLRNFVSPRIRAPAVAPVVFS